jgi:hypothetical protein
VPNSAAESNLDGAEPEPSGAVVDIVIIYDKERHAVLTQNVACAGGIILLACNDIFWQ